jgi:hypothetical protein
MPHYISLIRYTQKGTDPPCSKINRARRRSVRCSKRTVKMWRRCKH